MKMERQVTSLELSKKLKELGIKQESIFYWLKIVEGDYEITDRSNVYKPKDTFYSAFTVADLGEMLPRSINDKWFLRIKPVKNNEELWEINYIGKKRKDMTFRYSKMGTGIQGGTEANARASMLIYLIEHELVKIPSVKPSV